MSLPPKKNDQLVKGIQRLIKKLDTYISTPPNLTVESPALAEGLSSISKCLGNVETYLAKTPKVSVDVESPRLIEATQVLTEQVQRGLRVSPELHSELQNHAAKIDELIHQYTTVFSAQAERNLLLLNQQMAVLLRGFAEFTKLQMINPNVEVHGNYVSRNPTVVSTKAYELDVLAELGRVGRYGYIASDSGTILVRLNNREDIPLQVNDVLQIKVEHNLKVWKIRVTTTAASNTFRLFIA